MENADVVSIGGGVNGPAAFNLTSPVVPAGVIVVNGGISAPAPPQVGIARAHALHQRGRTRLAWESLKVSRLRHIVGGDCGFDAAGFVESWVRSDA